MRTYYLVAVEQGLLSGVSTISSLIAFGFLTDKNLADFIVSWTVLWSFVAILSEILVNPVRVSFNANKGVVMNELDINIIRTVLIYPSVILLTISLNQMSEDLISNIASSLALVLLVTAYSLRRNYQIDTKQHMQNIIEAVFLLTLVLLGLSICVLADVFRPAEVLISISIGYLATQLKTLRYVCQSFSYITEVFRIILKNLQFGLSTIIRIGLFSYAIMYVLSVRYSDEQLISYGLIFSLSNPGIILASLVSQIEFKQMAQIKTSANLRTKMLRFGSRIFLISILGAMITLLLAAIFTQYSDNYKYIIQNVGLWDLFVLSFCCIFFIGLSNLFSIILQILKKSNYQILSVSIGGIVGIFITYFINPMFGVFASYAGYVMFAIFLISAKGVGRKSNDIFN